MPKLNITIKPKDVARLRPVVAQYQDEDGTVDLSTDKAVVDAYEAIVKRNMVSAILDYEHRAKQAKAAQAIVLDPIDFD